MRPPESVEVVEVGPRDGLQSEEANVPTAGKVDLISVLRKAGLGRFEATSFVSPKAIPQLADAEEVVAALPLDDGAVYGTLIPNERGYERAKEAGVPEVVLVCAATEGYCKANLKRSVDEVLAGFPAVAKRGREDGVHVRANISTVFGDPFEGRTEIEKVLRVVEKVVESGIREISLSDTIGVANPRQVSDVLTRVQKSHPQVKFAAHFHDTRGLALANVVAALEAGITTFDSAIGGLGGSPYAPGATGNVATEDLVYMLTEMGVETGVDLAALMEAQDILVSFFDHPLYAKIDRSLLAAPDAAL